MLPVTAGSTFACNLLQTSWRPNVLLTLVRDVELRVNVELWALKAAIARRRASI